MKAKIFLFILISISFFLNAQTVIPGGNVSGNWTSAGSPYLVQGNIIVPNDSTLTIDPGVMVKFQGHYKLFCNGRILAQGSSSDSITFTVEINSIPVGWHGFRFENTPETNDTSRFDYCKILYGNASGTGNDAMGGAFFFKDFSKCIISNCYIANCTAIDGGGAIFCDNSSILIKNNLFDYNTSIYGGHGIEGKNNSNLKILYNVMKNDGGIYFLYSFLTIIGNTISDNIRQGGISCWGASSVINGNTITNNINENGAGGGGILLSYSASTVTNNIISNNYAPCAGGGITCSYSDAVIISNNLIINNATGNNTLGDGTGGSGIFCFHSSPSILNNTICNNESITIGGGIKCAYNSNPEILNCIIYGNTATSGNGINIYLDDNDSDPSFLYCDIEGGLNGISTNGNPYTGTFSNNIDSIPLFVSPSGGSGIGFDGTSADWSLPENSSCINAGNPVGVYQATDIAGNPRVCGTAIDIGAYELLDFTGLESSILDNKISVSPNPFKYRTTVQFEGGALDYELNMYNLNGIKVKNIKNISGDRITIERNNFPTGIYFISISNNNRIIGFKKLIITD